MTSTSLAELSESAYRKPVTDTVPPSAEMIAGAADLHTDGYGKHSAEWGVIIYVHRATADGGTEDVHKITWCDSARYRDDVLLPFYGFYDSTVRLERFGPDVRPDTLGDVRNGDVIEYSGRTLTVNGEPYADRQAAEDGSPFLHVPSRFHEAPHYVSVIAPASTPVVIVQRATDVRS